MIAKALVLLLCVSFSLALSPNFCGIMCQPGKASTDCQSIVATYKRSDKSANINFFCCLSNVFVKSNVDYLKYIDKSFQTSLSYAKDPTQMEAYATCIKRCSKVNGLLKIEDCDKHIKHKFTTCRSEEKCGNLG